MEYKIKSDVEKILESLPNRIKYPYFFYEWDFQSYLYKLLFDKLSYLHNHPVSLKGQNTRTSLLHVEYPVKTNGSKLRYDLAIIDPDALNDNNSFNNKKILFAIQTKISSLFEKHEH